MIILFSLQHSAARSQIAGPVRVTSGPSTMMSPLNGARGSSMVGVVVTATGSPVVKIVGEHVGELLSVIIHVNDSSVYMDRGVK